MSDDLLEILHFNDVYEIEESKDAVEIETKTGIYSTGGAARFVTAMEEHGSKEKLVLFSGDLLSPSSLS